MDLTDPLAVLARTIWGENRSGGARGMQSVANVVVNRANNPRWWGHSVLTVCLASEQFSCWMDERAPIEAVTVADASFRLALDIASTAIAGNLPDITMHSDSYFAASAPLPSWAKPAKFTVEIEGQRFYRLYLPPPAA